MRQPDTKSFSPYVIVLELEKRVVKDIWKERVSAF